MRKHCALLLAAVAFAAPAGAVAAATPQGVVPVTAAKTCGAGYVRGNLSWGVKCLRAGEFCKVGNREYLKYGFVCPATGHLRRR